MPPKNALKLTWQSNFKKHAGRTQDLQDAKRMERDVIRLIIIGDELGRDFMGNTKPYVGVREGRIKW